MKTENYVFLLQCCIIHVQDVFLFFCADASAATLLSLRNKLGGSTPAVSPNQKKELHTIMFMNEFTNYILSIIICQSLLIV